MQPSSARANKSSRSQSELPYIIELWRADSPAKVERALARAANAILARAIFKAAQGEHPERRITLRRGNRIIAYSASPAESVKS